jgi:formylglycine-generating enzyme required for sulfatase activity
MTTGVALFASGVLFSESRGQAAAVRKLAFVAGVSKYQKDGLTNLKYAEDDARDLSAELKKHGFAVLTVVGQEATLGKLTDELGRFFSATKKLSKEDVVLVSLSGHGRQALQGVEEHPFFCPYDARFGDTDTLLSLNWVMDRIKEDSASSQNLLLVDACRDNPAKGGKGVDGSTVRSLPNKLSVFFSSSAGTQSYESDKIRHGLFTHFVLDGLQGKAADLDGEVTWLGLSSYVMKQVRKESPNLVEREQSPNLLGNLVRQPVLAYVNRPVPFPPPRPPAPLAPGTVIENSIGTKLVLIPAGEFQMGSADSDTEASAEERPQHRVRLSNAYYLGKYELTQREWKAVMETEPWKGQDYVSEGDDYPAVYISHGDAEEYCRRLSALPAERAAGRLYRLPTEAEWEYGCRGGNQAPTKYHFGDSEADLVKYAWYDKNASVVGEQYARPVGQKLVNGYGLHDMHGNVWEWCSDVYASDYYGTSAASGPDPTGPSGGSRRVNRGGSWYSGAAYCRTALRRRSDPSSRWYHGGFRLALSFVGVPGESSQDKKK